MARNLAAASLGGSSAESFMRFQTTCRQGHQTAQGLTGLRVLFPRSLAVCRPSFSPPASPRLPECIHGMTAAFPESWDPKEKQGLKTDVIVFYNLILDTTYHITFALVLVRQTNIHHGRGEGGKQTNKPGNRYHWDLLCSLRDINPLKSCN